jgi:outer membrane beta-barrel protein
METRFQRILLTALLLACANVFAAEGEGEGDTSSDAPYDPKVERRAIDTSDIDTEDFEIGVNYGVISIEDFGTSEITGLRFHYHVTEDYFLQIAAGTAVAGTTSYERLSGGAQLLTEDGRDYRYYGLNFGWNVMPGETFITDNLSFNSAFYLVLGAGNTEFANDKRFTINYGAGYRFVLLDWLTAYIEAQNHLFDIDVTGENKRTNNIEFSTGFSFFF